MTTSSDELDEIDDEAPERADDILGRLKQFSRDEPPAEKSPEELPMPDWLSAAEEEPGEAEDSVPDWLPEIGMEDIPSDALETREVPGLSFRQPEKPAEDSGVPGWLRELGDEPPAAPAIPENVLEQGLEAEDTLGQLPQDQETEPAEAGDLPEWLQDLQGSKPPVQPVPPAASEDVPDDALETKDIPGLSFRDQEPDPAAQGDLPEWLQGLQPDAGPAEEETLEPAGPSELDFLGEPPADELPDINLAGLEDEPVEPGELPAWLGGMQPEAEAAGDDEITHIDEKDEILSEALETKEVPDLSFRDEVETPPADMGLADELAGDLPDWLQGVEGEELAEIDKPLQEPQIEVPVEALETKDIPGLSFRDQEPPPAEDIAEPGEADEDLPDWLSDFDAEEADFVFEEPVEEEVSPTVIQPGMPLMEEQVEDEAPPWMAEAEEPVEPAETKQLTGMAFEAEEPDLMPGEIPAWLKDVGSETTPGEQVRESPFLGAEPVEEEPVRTDPQPGEDMPDWLRSAGLETVIPLAMMDDEPEVSEPQEPDELEPAWLQASEMDREPPISLDRADMPDWLQGLQAAQDEAVPDASVLDELELPVAADLDEEVPAWLADLRAKTAELPVDDRLDEVVEEPVEAGPPVSEPDESPRIRVGVEPGLDDQPVVPGEMPAWISEMSPEAGDLTAGDQEDLDDDVDLEPAELPGWLKAMRPVEAVSPVIPPSEGGARSVEGVGPLAGLQGILPAEPEITQAGTPPAFSMRVEVTKNQYEHINRLKELLEEEADPQVVGQRWGVLQPQHLLRWVIALGLILAISIPLFLGFQLNPLPSVVPDETLDVGNLVFEMPANGRVLIGFDYQPGLAAEIDAAAEAVIDHMIRLHQAHLVLVSTSTTGPALAERFIANPLGVGEHGYVNGQDYVNLGYIPGGAAGLLDFRLAPQRVLPIPFNLQGLPDANNAWATPPLEGIVSLDAFDMVVILVDDAATARAWIEQVSPGLEGVPLVMVTSAQTAPLIRPYYLAEPRQVDGLVSGLAGGGAYQRINDAGHLTRTYWDAYGNGLLIAALLIVIGGAISTAAKYLRSPEPERNEEQT